jgi:hypothetical protein
MRLAVLVRPLPHSYVPAVEQRGVERDLSLQPDIVHSIANKSLVVSETE